MFILDSLQLSFEQDRDQEPSTLWFRDHVFARQRIYPRDEWQTAISACRRNLQAGLISLLVVDDLQDVSLWHVLHKVEPVVNQKPSPKLLALPRPESLTETPKLPTSTPSPAHSVAQDLLKRYRKGQHNFNDVDLEGIHLASTILKGIKLNRANLNQANFQKADLEEAEFSWSYLREANFSSATLIHARLESAFLNGATACQADLRGANLVQAELNRADLSSANMGQANLTGADLSDSNLTGANLSQSRLRHVNWKGAILTNANLSGADLDPTRLRSAHLNKTILPDGTLHT